MTQFSVTLRSISVCVTMPDVLRRGGEFSCRIAKVYLGDKRASPLAHKVKANVGAQHHEGIPRSAAAVGVE